MGIQTSFLILLMSLRTSEILLSRRYPQLYDIVNIRTGVIILTDLLPLGIPLKFVDVTLLMTLPYKIFTEISPISARISARFWPERYWHLAEISPISARCQDLCGPKTRRESRQISPRNYLERCSYSDPLKRPYQSY